ncbi:MAG TPA: hypothetical protein VME46_23170, partial [Acidimicrobiales bacterium]|nr:hypothetical protein [Acidimicrobiales bacterium]
VWGHSYVQQFLQFGLPSMLSPGNLPAVAAQLPCRLVVLTSSEDRSSIVDSPLMERVRAVGCEVQLRPIDHLITHTNQSTTITLACTEAIVAAGQQALETCFFLTTSDYIYAAGSLGSVTYRMLKGASAVLVGNFQVAREVALPSLRRIMEWSGQAPALSSRELMSWALMHLHPATVANTVNVPFNHNIHTNRLFWRVDGSTVLGRFYLRHPICVRPETTDFLIGSSLDYSYIPELCPSGNVTSITDSDEYLVVEMQPTDHEAAMLRYGPLRTKAFAKSLAEWTTKEHRANARDVHVFHSSDVPAEAAAIERESATFVAAVAERLSGRRPCRHRGHPYWKGAIAAFSLARSPESRARPLDHIYDLGHLSLLSRWWWRRQYLLLGQPPRVRPWDPLWSDYAAVRAELADAARAVGARLLLVSNRPTALSVGLSTGPNVQRLRTESIARNPPSAPEVNGAAFHACLVELADAELGRAALMVQRLQPYLVPGGRVLVIANVTHATAMRLAVLSPPGLSLLRKRIVVTSSVRRAAYRASRALHHLAARQPWAGVPIAVVLGPPVLAACWISNVLALSARQRPDRKVQGYSTLVMVLQAAVSDEGSQGRGLKGVPDHSEVPAPVKVKAVGELPVVAASH